MKKIFLFLIFNLQLGVCSFIFSQSTFVRSYGNALSETGTCIQNTLDGNYIISGMTTSFNSGYNNIYLLKIDPQSNLLWSKVYGRTGTGSQYAYFVSTCSDGGFILTGSTDSVSSLSNEDMFLMRTDSDGNLQWTTTVGGTSGDDFGWYVIQANDGGFVAVGSSTSFGNGSYDGYLVKVNSGGALQWTKDYGGTGGDFLFGINNTTDGGYILCGETSTNSFGSSDNWLIKTNSDGDTLWTKVIGRITEEAANAIFQTKDGGYVLTGDVHINTTQGAHHISIIKTDSSGNMLWNKAYGSSPGSEIAFDIKPAPDKGYNILGYSGYYSAGGKDFLFLKTDSAGTLQWAKNYGGTGDEDAWFFQPTSDGGFIMTGATNTFGSGQIDVFLVRTDSAGATDCYNSVCSPAEANPVLQSRSGCDVISGGTAFNPATPAKSVTTYYTNICPATGIKENNQSQIGVSVYPNPFSENTTLQITNGQITNCELKMYDVFGQEVQCGKIRNSKGFVINRSNLPQGIYFYKVLSPDKTIATGKIIIE